MAASLVQSEPSWSPRQTPKGVIQRCEYQEVRILGCLRGQLSFLKRLSLLIIPLIFFFFLNEEEKKESEVIQLCPTLCDSMDCSLPGSSVRGIFQARILEWVAIGNM